MGQIPSKPRFDVSQVAVKDLDMLIDLIEDALSREHVHTIIVQNEPYSDLKLSRHEASQMIVALKERVYTSMN